MFASLPPSHFCSKSFKNKLWKLVEEGTWMNHKPAAMFPERAPKKTKGPTALTDKQFTG